MSRRLNVAALSALVLLAGACGSSAGDGSSATVPEATPVPTIGGVGVLPEAMAADRAPVVMVKPPLNDDGSEAQLLGELVDGNRVLLIGDSVLASTSSRYGGNMCAELVPLGWQVQVEAEPSRFVEWGNRVLDRVLPEREGSPNDYDAAVVFLGSNYDGDEVKYETELREILDRLEPRPTLLLTVTEYKPQWAEVNVVVRELANEYENVRLVDWESVSQTPGVLSGDRLHPSDLGRQVLAELIAGSLGQVGVGDGDCLRSQFTNDSDRSPTSRLNPGSSDSSGSTSRGGGSSSSGGSSSGGSSSGSSGGGSSGGGSNSVTTTAKPPTTTGAPAGTTAPGGGGDTGGGGGDGTGGGSGDGTGGGGTGSGGGTGTGGGSSDGGGSTDTGGGDPDSGEGGSGAGGSGSGAGGAGDTASGSGADTLDGG